MTSVTVNSNTFSTQTQTALDSYTWPINGQVYTQSGSYDAIIVNAAGCDSTITLDITFSYTGVNDLEKVSFAIYPNPAYDLINIVMPNESVENFVLIDSRGRKVLEGNLSGKETKISVKEFAPGTYLLRVGGEHAPIRVVKID